MSRPIRIEFENACYHVMARGNEKKDIFKSDLDRQLFIRTLCQTIEDFNLVLYAFCLQSNHYHLLIRTPKANLSKAIGWLQTTYTIRYNKRHDRCGHLFQGRYKAHLVGADFYAKYLIIYIHINSVRPEDKTLIIPYERKFLLDKFPWSSHQYYSGKEKPPYWLNMDWLSYWGKDKNLAHANYCKNIDDFFGNKISSPWDNLKGGLVLGSEELFNKVKEIVANKKGNEEIKWALKQYKLGFVNRGSTLETSSKGLNFES